MCDVVDISDDEDCLVLENDDEVMPKDESLDYDFPPQIMCPRTEPDNVASSSGSNLRSSFLGMGFEPSLVDKAIEEHGEANADLLLETLFEYANLQQAKVELFDDGISSGDNNDLAAKLPAREAFHRAESSDSIDGLFGENANKNAPCDGNFPLKEEPDVGTGVSDEKVASLLKMNFSVDEARFAMSRLGKHASIGQLMDFIFAARMAKKYEKDPSSPFPGNEESDKDNNEALFGIMDKTLRLLEMGFSENEISAAFEKCGSEAPLPDLANSIVVPDFVPDTAKYASASVSNYQSLKRKMGDSSNNQSFDSPHIKIEDYGLDVASHIGNSDMLERSKGKKPKEEFPDELDELNIWKKPKEEFMEDSSSTIGLTWLEARRGNSRIGASSHSRVSLEEEDIKSIMSIPSPSKTLSSVVAKRPYFLYGNVTNLSRDSWVKITKFLYSLRPEFVNTESYSALIRREGYIHNLPTENRVHIFPKGPSTIEEAIPRTGKWWPPWDTRKRLSYITTETNGVSLLCDRIVRILSDSRGLLSSEQQRDILDKCDANNLMWMGNHKLAQIEPEHVERIMGYPLHHTRVASLSISDRFRSLKLSFQTDTLGYHLSVLRPLFIEGITVLSFFSGIGGAEVAIHRLGIPLKGLVSVEPCETKRKILKQWWEVTGQSGDLVQFESIHKLTRTKLEGLFKKFGGFDFVVCQNPYSTADSDSLVGLDFSMFAEFVRILQHVRSTMERNR